MTNEPDSSQPLDYAAPEKRTLPTWAHAVALVFWAPIVLIVYGTAIAAPLMTLVAIVLVFHPIEHAHAFGDPIVTTWQKARFVLYPVAVSAVFVPLAIWFHRLRTPNP